MISSLQPYVVREAGYFGIGAQLTLLYENVDSIRRKIGDLWKGKGRFPIVLGDHYDPRMQ